MVRNHGHIFHKNASQASSQTYQLQSDARNPSRIRRLGRQRSRGRRHSKKTIGGAAIGPLHPLLLLATILDVEVRATWIPTEENALAALSRFDMTRVAALTGQDSFSLPSRQTSHISQKISRLMQDFTSFTAPPSPPERIPSDTSRPTAISV